MRNPFQRPQRFTIAEFTERGLDNAIILIGHAVDRDNDAMVDYHSDMSNVELRITCSALAVHCAALLRSIDENEPRRVLQEIALGIALAAPGEQP